MILRGDGLFHPNIIPENRQDPVIAYDPGKDPLTVLFLELFQGQVGGDDGRLSSKQPLIYT